MGLGVGVTNGVAVGLDGGSSVGLGVGVGLSVGVAVAVAVAVGHGEGVSGTPDGSFEAMALASAEAGCPTWPSSRIASIARLRPTPITRAPITTPATAAIRLGDEVMVDHAARMRFTTRYPHAALRTVLPCKRR